MTTAAAAPEESGQIGSLGALLERMERIAILMHAHDSALAHDLQAEIDTLRQAFMPLTAGPAPRRGCC